MPNNVSLQKEKEITLISSDIEFSGDLQFDRELEIQGSFEGKIGNKRFHHYSF